MVLGTARQRLASFNEARLRIESLGQSVQMADQSLYAQCQTNLDITAKTIDIQEQVVRRAESEAAEKRRLAQEAEERRVNESRLAVQRKLVAARQQYAESLASKMSQEIIWCAIGTKKDTLAGYVRVAHLSDSVVFLLSAQSPLWGEFFSNGFRYRGILDSNGVTKIAEVTERGGFALSVDRMPPERLAALNSTVRTLASNGSCGSE
jgi:hypothetical protein